MRPVAQHRPDLLPYDAFLAASRVWLAQLVLWLSTFAADQQHPRRAACARALLAPIAPMLRVELRESAAALRNALFMKARAELTFCGVRRGAHRYQPHRAADIRTLMRALIGPSLGRLNAGTLLERAARLKHIVEHQAHYIARIAARILALGGRICKRRLILPNPRNDAAPGRLPCVLIYNADTS